MKFSSSIVINKPRDLVVELFKNPEYLKHYQDGFQRKELISGNAGEDGAVSNMYYKMGKNEMELKETITANRLPESFSSTYEHKYMDNTMECRFIVVDENTTRYEADYEYTRLNWIMPKLIAILFPGIYRKQGEKWMNNFKVFAESQE